MIDEKYDRCQRFIYSPATFRARAEFRCSLNKIGDIVSRDRDIVVAVSGGSDSMALLLLCMDFYGDENLDKIHVISIDHNLRPESKEEVLLVDEFCKSKNIDFTPCSISIGPKKGNIEKRARDKRLDVYRTASNKFGCPVLLGHHANDNAETFVMKLIANPKHPSPNVMKTVEKFNFEEHCETITIVRPLLSITKDELTNVCLANNVKYCVDKSNFDTSIRRNFVRNNIMQNIYELNPSFWKTISNDT